MHEARLPCVMVGPEGLAISRVMLVLFGVGYFPEGSRDERSQGERDPEVDDNSAFNGRGRRR